MIERVGVKISGVVEIEIPDGTDLQSMSFDEYRTFVDGYIDWDHLFSVLRVQTAGEVR